MGNMCDQILFIGVKISCRFFRLEYPVQGGGSEGYVPQKLFSVDHK